MTYRAYESKSFGNLFAARGPSEVLLASNFSTLCERILFGNNSLKRKVTFQRHARKIVQLFQNFTFFSAMFPLSRVMHQESPYTPRNCNFHKNETLQNSTAELSYVKIIKSGFIKTRRHLTYCMRSNVILKQKPKDKIAKRCNKIYVIASLAISLEGSIDFRRAIGRCLRRTSSVGQSSYLRRIRGPSRMKKKKDKNCEGIGVGKGVKVEGFPLGSAEIDKTTH